MNEFVSAIYRSVWGEIGGKLHTACPAEVNSYDPAGPSVEVTPMVRRVLEDGTVLQAPRIAAVPLVFPRTNRFHVSFPIEVGDMVLLVFAERSIEEFLVSGKRSTPDNARMFSLTDAIAIPGLFGFKKGSAIEDGSKMEIVFDEAKIVSDGASFEFTGDVKINGKLETTDDLSVTGKVEATGKVSAGTTMEGSDFVTPSVSFLLHAHATAAVGPPSPPVTYAPPPPVP